MAATALNTLHYARRLKSAGVPDVQAETMAEALDDVLVAHIANKADVAELRADFAELRANVTADVATLRTEFAELRTGFAELRAETRTDIAAVRTDIAALSNRLFWRLTGAMAVLLTIAVSLVSLA